jgi:hypothetical protein
VRKDELPKDKNPWKQVTRSIREGARLTNQSLGLLQCVARVAEVAIGRDAAVDRLLQVGLLRDYARRRLRMISTTSRSDFFACAVCVDEDRQGLGDADGVGELDECEGG